MRYSLIRKIGICIAAGTLFFAPALGTWHYLDLRDKIAEQEELIGDYSAILSEQQEKISNNQVAISRQKESISQQSELIRRLEESREIESSIINTEEQIIKNQQEQIRIQKRIIENLIELQDSPPLPQIPQQGLRADYTRL